MPSTEGLFRTMWEIDRDWMPEVRQLVDAEEKRGKRIARLTSLGALNTFA